MTGLVPGGDLTPPAHDGAPEALHLRRAGLVLEIDAELRDELASHDRVIDVRSRTHHFLGVPGGADLAAGVAGVEEPAGVWCRCRSSRRSWAMVINLRIR